MSDVPDRSERNVNAEREVYASPLHAIYITRQEAADLLRVSPTTIDTYYYRGLIDKFKTATGNSPDGEGGGRTLFLREQILGLVKKCPPIPPGHYPKHARRKWNGNGLAEQPDLVEARSKDEVQREALKRYDEERKRR